MGLGYPLISGNTHVSLYLWKDTINDRRDCPQEIKWSDWTEKINSEKLKSRKSDTACPTDNWQSVCFRICPRLGLSDNGPPQDCSACPNAPCMGYLYVPHTCPTAGQYSRNYTMYIADYTIHATHGMVSPAGKHTKSYGK